MKTSRSTFLICILIIAGLVLMIPVTAETTASVDVNKPSITAGVSPSSPRVGDMIAISGLAKGGNLTPGLAVWIFAGNYVNITHVPVNASGFYSQSINSSGFPPAYYYIFVQHPGSDNKFNINTTGYAGEVVNTNTGAVIFNFTGTGSVTDNAAAIALSNAFNSIGVDDVFAKTGVQLLPASSNQTGSKPTQNGIQPSITVANASQTQVQQTLATQAVTMQPTKSLTTEVTVTPTIPRTTKSPMSIIPSILGIGFVIFGISLWRKK